MSGRELDRGASRQRCFDGIEREPGASVNDDAPPVSEVRAGGTTAWLMSLADRARGLRRNPRQAHPVARRQTVLRVRLIFPRHHRFGLHDLGELERQADRSLRQDDHRGRDVDAVLREREEVAAASVERRFDGDAVLTGKVDTRNVNRHRRWLRETASGPRATSPRRFVRGYELQILYTDILTAGRRQLRAKFGIRLAIERGGNIH